MLFYLALLHLGLFSQAHASQTCFAADGVYLKTAVSNYIGGTWGDGGDYGAIEDWCTKDVTTMAQLFKDKTTFNADISKWDTSSVTDMSYMFWNAKGFNQNISGWDTSKVSTMSRLFPGAESFNQDLSRWNTSSVTDMHSVFYNALSFNASISEWDTSKVTTMRSMFLGARSFDQDIGGWDTSKVTSNMYAMFVGAHVFNQNLTKWDTSNVNRMQNTFTYAYNFNGDVSGWDTSKVTNFGGMFGQTKFNGDVSEWDTSKGVELGNMFGLHTAGSPFNRDVSKWNTSSATSMGGLFARTPFNQDISGWDTSKVTNMQAMFEAASSFNQSLSQWDTSSVKNMYGMFRYAESFNEDLSGWDTSSVETFYAMFEEAKAFNQDVSGFDLSSAQNVRFMFNGASMFNQNLCAWKDELPYIQERDNIFRSSGCYNKAVPNSPDDAFCAGTAQECQDYTHLPTSSPTQKYPPTNSPTQSPTPAIKSWDLELSSVNTDFGKDSVDEITLNYKVGKDRKHNIFVLTDQCKEEITPEGVINHTSSILADLTDPLNEGLTVSVDIDKKALVGSNILFGDLVKVCLKVELVSVEGDNERVIKKLERNIQVALDFENEFETIDDAKFGQIVLGSNETSAAVDDYIKACTCGGNSNTYVCNTNVLGVDDYLNVCVSSLDPEMKINYLESLAMEQDGTTLNIVSNSGLEDSSISSKSTRADESGVHVASVIPASFFSYESTSTAKVSGVVFLKLSGSRRRLAVEIDRALQSVGDQESTTFSMEVQLQKNELEVADDSNGAAYAVKIGVVGVAAAVVTASTIMMW